MLEGGPVRESLELLLELQRIDDRLLDIERRASSLPAKLEALEAERTNTRQEIERQEAMLEEASRRRRHLDRELEDESAKLQDLLSKQLSIKTNEEYSALQHEIEFTRRSMSEKEDEILSLLEEIDRLDAQIEEVKRSAAGRKEEIEQAESELRVRVKELEDAAAVKRDERLRLSKRIDRPVLERYERILESKGDSAVAVVVDGACGGCYKRLPPQTLVEVKRSDRLMECQGCGRILCWIPGESRG